MQDISFLSFLKLRASWGSLGNERIGNYPYQSTIAYGSALFYQGTNIVSSQTAAQRYYAIEDISWETTESFDVGFDAVLFDNRFHVNADYYQKTTKDMLLELEIPDVTVVPPLVVCVSFPVHSIFQYSAFTRVKELKLNPLP